MLNPTTGKNISLFIETGLDNFEFLGSGLVNTTGVATIWIPLNEPPFKLRGGVYNLRIHVESMNNLDFSYFPQSLLILPRDTSILLTHETLRYGDPTSFGVCLKDEFGISLKNRPIVFEIIDNTSTSVLSHTSYTNDWGIAIWYVSRVRLNQLFNFRVRI